METTWLVSYPRAGSTWVRHIFSYLLEGPRGLFLGAVNRLFPDVHTLNVDLDSYLLTGPRFLKSHHLLLPQYHKVIYLHRDGRDSLLSGYPFFLNTTGPYETWQEYFDRFLKGDLPFGSWKGHVRFWITPPKGIEVLSVGYQTLLENTVGTIMSMANFVGLEVTTDRIEEAVSECVFHKMRDRFSEQGVSPAISGCQGRSGWWKIFFSQEMKDRFWTWAGEELQALGYSKE